MSLFNISSEMHSEAKYFNFEQVFVQWVQLKQNKTQKELVVFCWL